MFKSLAVVSLAATAAFAADSLVPSGISSGCSTFLTNLNTDSAVQSCLSPLVTATAAYGPGGASTKSTAAITSALGSLCATSSSCDTTIRSKLADFYSACSAELTSGNKDVITMYDVLYVLTPFKNAVCAKNDSGAYCAVSSGAASTSSVSANVNLAAASTSGALTSAQIQNYLWISNDASKKRAEAAVTVNATTFSSSNLVFLFLKPTTPTAELCVSCTRSILTAYINFESNVQYGPGLASSPLLAGQTALIAGVKSSCGESFLSGTVQAAGGIAGGTLSDENNAAAGVKAVSVASALLTLAGMGVAVML